MFGSIVAGRPVQTNLVTISPTQFAFAIPTTPSFSHIVVFLLPGNALPNDTAAAVYIQFPGSPDFKFLGAIANEKPSAIFKVYLPGSNNGMMDGTMPMAGDITLGISVEPIGNIAAQLDALQQEKSVNSTALTTRPPSTKILAQRIIQNAFNFLSSFAGGPGGNEVVPLKSFQDWWAKFERRIDNDPGFLERDDQS
ncbi:MAG: hypothetical protein M1834_001588 [Cirrosporium novae-zelandiae]|nr:MAG: hypothetical protein M1834_004105 [Cirrosporium novae-zelandiae]KAI9735572.1 MAG: hypothetical protein M1834_001588 [Cirrosporium novae-zelandiae]